VTSAIFRNFFAESWETSVLNRCVLTPNCDNCMRRWYHGVLGRVEAEEMLRQQPEGSFLVRMSESNKEDYSLSLKYIDSLALQFH
jgi:hypothetical protein